MPGSDLLQSWLPGRGILADVRGRLPYYQDDWLQGCSWGAKVFAPATYIFFASALPALAFGQQLAMDTDGTLTVVHVLISTALAGLVQSILGGQPLLITGVAEPIVLIYGFMFSFCSSTPGLGRGLFLPWCGWVCVWTALLCLLLALSNACQGISRFTRFSGELFGALIAILFLQVGIKGIVHEFQPTTTAAAAGGGHDPNNSESPLLLLVNGLWGLFLAAGLLLSSLKVLTARGWLIGRAWWRGLLADYGVPLLVVAWSAISFAVRPPGHAAAAGAGGGGGVPRRVQTPNTWEVNDNWSVASKLADVPGNYIAAALLPAAIITVLFYFDHNVSSQLAQQPEFNLQKPAAYHYDFLLLAALTLVCGLLGLPPVNGVLPQAPMHTRSLAHIRRSRHNQHHKQRQQTNTPTAEAMQQNTHNIAAAEAQMDRGLSVNDGRSTTGGSTASAPAGCTSQGSSQTPQHRPGLVTAPPAAAAAAAAGGAGASCGTPHTRLPCPGEGSSPCSAEQLPASLQSPADCANEQEQQQQQGRQRRGSGELRQRHTHQSLGEQEQQQQCHVGPDAVPPAAAGTPWRQQQQQHADGILMKEVSSEVQLNRLPDSAADGGLLLDHDNSRTTAHHHLQQQDGQYLQLEVREQRMTNLLQSLLLCVCLGITPGIQLIPTAVLWGYFMFMAVESLTGSQLWERTLLLVTDPKKRVIVLQQEHAAYLQLVPHQVVVCFTLLQLVYLLGVWALTTWAGIAGVAFPLPIMALVPVRQYLLPLLFKQQHLAQLDAASYEEAPPITDRAQAQQELYAVGALVHAHTLPVAGALAAGSADQAGDGSDEGEMLHQEFKGHQLKHHLTAEEVEQQRSL